ncbi:AMP-binding protein [Paracoccaceae bacterium]|nr:AMP-binding protein [Paracoccaceae bacterium]
MTNILYDKVFGSNLDNNKIFLQTEEKQVSYENFTILTNKIANILVSQGLNPGDRVAAQVEKSVTQLALYAATIKAGGVYLPLNTAYTPHELNYFISNARPKIIVTAKDTVGELEKLFSSAQAIFLTLNADGTGSLGDKLNIAEANFKAASRSEQDLAVIMYTSGTTGKSKGAKLTHQNLASNCEVLEKSWEFSNNDVLLHMLPTYHTHGLLVACNLLAMVGGSMIFLPKFNVENALKWIPKATSMMGVPTYYTRLLDSPKFNKNLSKNIRLFISGSAPLSVDTHKMFKKRTGLSILERYGMTETNMSTSNPYRGKRIAGTIGKPLPGVEVRITDRVTGKVLPNDNIGVIEQRGENVFSGYWEMPEKTRESFTPDNFFITGDLAKRDKNGYITLVGRDSDMIISGGLNVYPKEVENHIDQIHEVRESAVIGVPHPDLGEGVVAVVDLKEKLIDQKKIEDILKPKLAKFKQPKYYIFVEELPRNAMGKIQKASLREQFKELFKS